MLVVVPTYKRLDCLRLSLLSIFNNELPPDETCRLVISNNYPPHSEAVEEIVTTLCSHPNFNKWQVVFHHQLNTVPAVDNWYQTILDFANEEEMVVLHGDDDLLTPWSLADRLSLLATRQADFLLTGVCSGLTFLSITSIQYRGNWPVRNRDDQGQILSFSDFEDFGNVFIGSQTYRFTPNFKAAIKQAKQWTETQTWLDYETRNIMFPYYLLVAIQLTPAKVIGCHWHGCIRGTSLHERVNAPFNHSYGWNSGVMDMLVLELMNHPDLLNKPLDRTRELLAYQAANWYLTLYLDPRVTSVFRRELLKRVNVKMSFKNCLFGIKVILQQYLGLKAISIRWDIWRNRNIYTPTSLLKEISIKQRNEELK
ncbi:MAG: hypothetical protein IM606_16930 [Cytophagales bacterium]|jgi:hypothetical protein|nr:hypothetical protein [Cytophagales bacterium]MCA6388648.1 hypothetical protein [Cytophagales bacterium]MCA6393284.1 hypothetical protein [Cytophagales bacterium]MCA6396870.1 hypothetical protein [Cytophagales bacterium]MCA6398006.1 hypothetical protein [Cytophagales bacterium]